MADFHITFHGTVATLDALSDACLSWVSENVATSGWQWLGKRSVAVEPRYVPYLVEALREAGFTEDTTD